MTLRDIATQRHTCKSFDPSRRIDDDKIAQLKTLLRLMPSSVNSQPWHFIVAESAASKTQIGETLAGAFAYNQAKVQQASHVIVLCARKALDDAYLTQLLDQEALDGRFRSSEAKAGQQKSRQFYVSLHVDQLKDLDAWVDRQVYLALGGLLLGAAELGIDACPMEGIDVVALNQTLNLDAQGLRAVVMVALGYRSENDFNAATPKSRLPENAVISVL